MSIQPHRGILNIPNATLRVGKLEIDSTAGFDTVLNSISTNTVLLEDVTEYTENNQWALKMPNVFVATFEIQGANSSFNFQNTSVGTATTGYTLDFNGTTLTLKYGGATLTTATIPNLDATYGKVYLTYEKQYFTVTVDGTQVLAYKDTVTRTPPDGEYVNFFAGTGTPKFENLKVVAGHLISDGTSNVSLMSGNLGIGTDTPLDTLHVDGGIRFAGHIIPTANEQYDIGSPAFKIRDMYVSDNSLWIGDEAKISFTGNQIKFRRRKKSVVPSGLTTLGAAHGKDAATVQSEALASASGVSTVADMKLHHWMAYAKSLDTTKTTGDIFTDSADDYEVSAASEAFKEVGDDIYSAHNVSIGKSTAPTTALDVNGTVTATAFVGAMPNLDATKITTGTLDRNTTGSAAKLTAAVAIGGVDFDGSANITLPGVNADGNQNTSGNAATATQWATGRTIEVTGGVTGTTSAFDGSEDATLVTTLADLDAAKITSGTLPVTRGGTGTTTSTGTGSVVLSAAPAFTGDVTFDTDTLKIDSTNNRVGIGTDVPSSKLTVNQIPQYRSTYDHSLAPMTVTNRAVTSNTTLNDPKDVLNLAREGTSGQAYGARATFKLSRYENSGTDSRTRLDLNLAHGSYDDQNIMTLLSNGNVGIGTTNPVGVNGGQRLEGSSSTGFEYIATRDDTTGNSGDFVGAYLFKNADTAGTEPHYAGMSSKLTGTNGPMDLRFHTNRDKYEDEDGIPQMIIDAGGNVGIGTTSPSTKFTLYGDDTEDEGGLLMKVVNRVALNNGFTGIGLGGYSQVAKSAIIHERTGYNGTGNLMFCNDGTTDNNDVSNTHARMTITSSGNVGIGTASPETTLQLHKEVGDDTLKSAAEIKFSTNNSANTTWDVGSIRGAVTLNAGGSSNYPGGLVFATKSPGGAGDDLTDKMVIDANGNVGIGTTSPDVKLQVEGTSSSHHELVKLATWNIYHNNSNGSADGVTYYTGNGSQGTDFFDNRNNFIYVQIPEFSGETLYTHTIIASNATAFKMQLRDLNGVKPVPPQNTLLRVHGYSKRTDPYGNITTRGNVGIGTTSPGAKLDVNGNLRVTGGIVDTSWCSGSWLQTCTESPTVSVYSNNGGGPMTVPSHGGSGMGGNRGRFTAKTEGNYLISCCAVHSSRGSTSASGSELLVVFHAVGTNWNLNNVINTYDEIIDLRTAPSLEEAYTFACQVYMNVGHYFSFRVHSSDYIDNGTHLLCSAALVR